ncbi:hypothetical protein DRE_07774 [Drechslerella stenobrocha 248]|uniref:Uncharacterized protein n=1 Tax=Drechslerella stenobrocha 248 TaxID=1043628 RepID=W7IGI9_9PEZI|nr:hypothetical protein DRE_07774 [Drechslerella stenobrocha 248]
MGVAPIQVPSYGQIYTPGIRKHSSPRSQSDASSVHSLVERVYTTQAPAGEREDPFTAFCMATKPVARGVPSRALARQARADKTAAQIEAGGFYDSGDEDEDEDEEDEGEDGMTLHQIKEEEDGVVQTDTPGWWTAGIPEDDEEEEDDDEDNWGMGMRRVPSLEFPRPGGDRESSVSTDTTTDEGGLHPPTPTGAEMAAEFGRIVGAGALSVERDLDGRKRRGRRRTASSECLIMAAEGVRGMVIAGADEWAVEEEDIGV